MAAYSFIRTFIDGGIVKIIYADEDVLNEINDLFNKITLLRRIQVIKGKYRVKDSLPLTYFKEILEEIMSVPEYEALEKLNKQLDFIKKLIETLEKSFKENPFRAKQIFESIREEPLKSLLQRLLEEKYSITI